MQRSADMDHGGAKRHKVAGSDPVSGGHEDVREGPVSRRNKKSREDGRTVGPSGDELPTLLRLHRLGAAEDGGSDGRAVESD